MHHGEPTIILPDQNSEPQHKQCAYDTLELYCQHMGYQEAVLVAVDRRKARMLIVGYAVPNIAELMRVVADKVKRGEAAAFEKPSIKIPGGIER
jgi:hypothetical protein